MCVFCGVGDEDPGHSAFMAFIEEHEVPRDLALQSMSPLGMQVSDYTALLVSNSWSGNAVTGAPKIVTYSFETQAATYLTADGGWSAAFVATFQPFGETAKTTTRDALRQWDDASGLVFVEVPAGMGDIKFSHYEFDLDTRTAGFTGWGYYPQNTFTTSSSFYGQIGGDVFIDLSRPNPSMYLMLHEIGHAIGLKHPFTGTPTLPPTLDNHSNTVMSYTGSYPGVLGPFDIQAAQFKYGLNTAPTSWSSFSWNAATLTLTQTGTANGETIVGAGVADAIFGAGGADTLVGLAGGDTLDGGAGIDRLIAGTGDDLLIGGADADAMFGEAGIDTVSYATASMGVVANMLSPSGNTNDAAGDSYSGIENMIGSAHADTLTGNGSDNVIDGGTGADSLFGGGGNDTLWYTPEDATIDGGSGFDTARAATNAGLAIRMDAWNVEQLFAGAGNDVVFTFGTASYAVDGGAGDDALSGNAFGDTLGGNVGNDNLQGRGGNDQLGGGEGDDAINGEAGTDQLRGEAGNDTLYFDLQDSVIDGGAGFDTAIATTNDGLTIRMDAWNIEQLFAGAGGDDIFTFGTAAVFVDGGAGNDSIRGNAFGDTLGGNAGNDVLLGLQGNDILGGGSGSDRLMGGEGADLLFGESGPDAYVYSGLIDAGDQIVGFERGSDKIEIWRNGFFDPAQWSAGALDPNRFVAGAATLATGQFLFDTNTGRLFWDGDGTGAGVAQLLLTVQGVNNLSAADFVLV